MLVKKEKGCSALCQVKGGRFNAPKNIILSKKLLSVTEGPSRVDQDNKTFTGSSASFFFIFLSVTLFL
jgi:hypothetical protein